MFPHWRLTWDFGASAVVLVVKYMTKTFGADWMACSAVCHCLTAPFLIKLAINWRCQSSVEVHPEGEFLSARSSSVESHDPAKSFQLMLARHSGPVRPGRRWSWCLRPCQWQEQGCQSGPVLVGEWMGLGACPRWPRQNWMPKTCTRAGKEKIPWLEVYMDSHPDFKEKPTTQD